MRKIISAFLVIISIFLYVKPALAESLTVTATVDTAFTFQGYTAPNSIVTFKENDAVIGTTISDSTGYFEKEFNNQTTGIHDVEMYSTNPDNVTTVTVAYEFLLLTNQTMTVSNIYLPPSISISKTSYSEDENVTVSGYSVPSSLIKIEFSGNSSHIDFETTNAGGYYSHTIAANDLSLGESQVTTTLDIVSVTTTTSNALTFSINSSAPTATPTSTTTTSSSTSQIAPTTVRIQAPTPSPSPVPCPYPYPNLCFFDLERLGFFQADRLSFINYIVAFVKNFGRPVSLATDINNDQVVDSIDLSIVFYYVKASSYKVLGINTSPESKDAVLGASVQNLEFPYTVINNNLMGAISNPSIKLIMNLLVMEVVVGLPFFVIFLFLIVLTKKNARK